MLRLSGLKSLKIQIYFTYQTQILFTIGKLSFLRALELDVPKSSCYEWICYHIGHKVLIFNVFSLCVLCAYVVLTFQNLRLKYHRLINFALPPILD